MSGNSLRQDYLLQAKYCRSCSSEITWQDMYCRWCGGSQYDPLREPEVYLTSKLDDWMRPGNTILLDTDTGSLPRQTALFKDKPNRYHRFSGPLIQSIVRTFRTGTAATKSRFAQSCTKLMLPLSIYLVVLFSAPIDAFLAAKRFVKVPTR